MLKVLLWWLSLIILPFASMAARYTAELHCSYGKGIYQDVRLHSSDWLIQRIVTLCYGKGWVSFHIFARRPFMFRRSPRAFAPHHSGLINANVGAAVRLALSRLQLKCSSDGWAASERPSSYTFLTSELLPTFLTKYLLFLFFFFPLQKEWFMYKDEPISQSLWYTETPQSKAEISKLCPNNRGEYHSDITKIRGSVGTRGTTCAENICTRDAAWHFG